MSDSIEIRPSGPIDAAVRPPGSKSITNRALICAALADGSSTLTGALDSEDTRVMVVALGQLGIDVEHDSREDLIRLVGSAGRIPAMGADLYVANSGTTVRFLTAMVAVGHSDFRLDGTPRMRERPIKDLLAALGQLGVNAVSENDTGCPPVLVRANGMPGGSASIAGDISSQYLSGLLMAAPYAESPVTLDVEGELVSRPYVRMTTAVMKSFGVDVQEEEGGNRFLVPCLRYQGQTYDIEPDASAASYFFAAAAVTKGRITVQGLSRKSLQGDVAFCELLERMGCLVEYGANSITLSAGPLVGIKVDMNAISDTVQTLAAVALFADGPTTVTNVANIRHKETDRLTALVTELRKLGAAVEEFPDGLRITPGELRPAEIDTYDDHRMAMSLAIVGLRQPGVVIRDPGCTAKTYPEFFADLERITNL